MLVVLAVLMLWNRGCTAFLTHETLTPHARSRVLYYSLVQVQKDEGRGHSKYVKDYAPPLTSMWRENDHYQKGLVTVKRGSKTEGESWGDNDLTLPVDWQMDEGKLDFSTNNSSSVVSVRHPDIEEKRNSYEQPRYIPTRSYWRVQVMMGDNKHTFDVVTVVVKGGLRSEFSAVKTYDELQDFYETLVKQFDPKDVPILPPPEENEINNFFQALFSGSTSHNDYNHLPLMLSCPNFYDFVGAPPELWELPSQVLEGEVVMDEDHHKKNDQRRTMTSANKRRRRIGLGVKWLESEDYNSLYSEIGGAVFGGLIAGPLGVAAGAIAGHHLAKKESIAGDVARSLGRVTEEIIEIGKELDEDIGVSKRLTEVLNRVKKSIQNI